MTSFLRRLFGSKKPDSTKFPNVVVGKIIDIESHPNANRLQLATVDVGKRLRIVCGAPNIAVGQFVPVALVGASLANGLVIQQAAIRGVDSEGMLCAEDELGIGSDHSGIMVFESARVGDPIDNYLNK
jgi:phenylalanyl-tRNA synthetase beta chain